MLYNLNLDLNLNTNPKKSTEHTEDTECLLFIGYRLKIFFKIFIKISSISDAIQNKTLPKSEELERILVNDFR